jgi:serine/threonine protein kinase
MAVRIESMAEPLPGYRLIERLGGGGFGEVWKAEAPGGLFKAIKFVYGDLEAADDEGARAGQEFKALKRVITVRHPFILSVERFDIIEGRLIIVTELADRTLWDRFRECRGNGQVGIPRDELLRYMQDTAEALDLMNAEYQLQHLDIKPQNLFLVHNHVKVADFGLVKDLEGMLASVTGGVTPVYAAPETFEGKVSRYSDQYSLAIVYQELLTGHRPYTGTTLRQLVMQHCQGTPDLRPLPESDRPLILRALSKKHIERFPSCTEFIESLRRAGQPTTEVQAPAPAPQEAVDPDDIKTNGAPPATAPTCEPDGHSVTCPPGPVACPTPAPAPMSAPTLVPAEPRSTPPAETPSHAGQAVATPSGPARPPSVTVRADGVLLPGVIIGVGKFGLGTLRQLRKEIADHFGSPDALPCLRLLYVDTDPESIQQAPRGPAQLALHQSELVHTRLHRPSHYRKPHHGETDLETWLHPKMLYRIPRQQTTAGVRALGRLAFVDHYKALARRLRIELEECCTPRALQKSVTDTGVHLASFTPRIWLAASLAGATGGGMFIDLAYLVRLQLQDLGYDGAELVGLCYLPHVDRDARRVPELANTFAALRELNHFSTPHCLFSASYEMGELRGPPKRFQWRGPAFHRCLLLGLPPGPLSPGGDDSAGPVFSQAHAATLGTGAHLIFADLATALGRSAERRDAKDEDSPKLKSSKAGEATGRIEATRFHLPGLYRLVWPRRQLLEQAAVVVCRRVVQRWMSKDARALRDVVRQWVEERWQEHGFPADQLISRYRKGCEKALGQSPESVFQVIHQRVTAAFTPMLGKSAPANGEPALNVSVVIEALSELEQLVGIPEECRPTPRPGEPSSYQPGSLENSLKEVAAIVVDRYEQKLAELVVWLIEQPAYRLAGAEEALRQLRAWVENALQTHEQLAHELQQRAAQAYQRLQRQLENTSAATPSSSLWRQAFGRRRESGPSPILVELMELVAAFPKLRYQSMIMQHVTTLYVSLRGLLSDQLREVDYCRARLGELLSLLAESADDQSQQTTLAAGRYLLTDGCSTLDEAVKKLEGTVVPLDLVELDGQIQSVLRRQFKALVHVCMTSANILKSLAPAMQKEARSYLQGRLGATSVAELFLKRAGDTPEKDLDSAFEEAAPEVIASSTVSERIFLAVPQGEAEAQVREVAAKSADGVPWIATKSTDEIVVYREQTLRCLADLKQLGPLGLEAYQKLIATEHFTPHSRNDIVEWGIR